jgi:hypothetical protein
MIRLIPSRRQWSGWSLPSKLTAIGAYVGVLAVFLGILFFLPPFFWPTKPAEKRTDELISLFEYRANRIRNELKPYYEYTDISSFLGRFDELHTKHVAALRTGDFILAHEILLEIHKLSFDLEGGEFWSRHDAKTPHVVYDLDTLAAFGQGPMVSLYATGEFRSKHIPSISILTQENQLDESTKIYKEILNGADVVSSLFRRLRRMFR